MSIIEMIWGIGMVLGGGILGFKQFRINPVVMINSTFVLLGLSFLLSGVLPPNGFVVFVILTAFGGIAGAIYSALFTATIQRVVAPEALGRVFSLYGSVAVIPSLIGLTATGFIADYIGIDFTFIISGAIIILVGIVAMFVPDMINLGKTKMPAIPVEVETEV